MATYLKKFETQAAYNAALSSLISPNVSLTVDNNRVHYDIRVIAKFNVTSTSNSVRIVGEDILGSMATAFTSINIDGVEQPSVTTEYTFSTTGEHTVKYTLADPTSIGQNAFNGCISLTSVTIPESVTSIDMNAFDSCSGLTSIVIPNSVTSIGNEAFQNCNRLTSITIPDSVTSIGDYAFQFCSGATSCTIGSGVTSIGSGAFYQCSGLTSVVIPSGVTSIDMNAFARCSGLTSCTIGSGVTSIGNQAFYNCTSLTSITSNATTAPTIQSGTFRNIKTGGTLTVPSGSSGYDTWMKNANYYLGLYNWKKVKQ